MDTATTRLTFSSEHQHRAWLATQAALPNGFKTGVTRFNFTPAEAPKPAAMTLTLITLDKPTPDFAAVFTQNAFPGAPVIIGRRRLAEPTLGAILVNNKISNVCAPGGIATAERICAATAARLHMAPAQILPSSTGVIGWSLPEADMLAALPRAIAALDGAGILPAAEGIMTTDLYPKIRRAKASGGTIVAIGKGAGMIEPNMATLLVYILTDLAIPRNTLRETLSRTVATTFNTISIDSDTSTSDSIVALSSGHIPCADTTAFETALEQVCRELAGDIVRNGEGVRHVIRVHIKGAPDATAARALGKAIVNAPLFKCAIAGNDPNVGRLIQAIGKHAGTHPIPTARLRASIGGIEIFANGTFQLNPAKETALADCLRAAELYPSAPDTNGFFAPPIKFPPHERCVEIEIALDSGHASATVLGADLTHEYVSENADYRS
ncbi:MAG: bifunctional ornithine acetyltransferase/N-acetylglutamate synthase [Puniceicoccales bacterium]|jgi:glutamate N-acetyltransferase/amino-acid N-acetyltransferase|nr:bifunctional ornithine acetyltransferase/N-acetylglutamate synthase [Puniceicoccales bacterium]